MIRSSNIVVRFLALVNIWRCLAGIVVLEEKRHALQDDVLPVFGFAFQGVLDVGEANAELYHGVLRVEGMGSKEVT